MDKGNAMRGPNLTLPPPVPHKIRDPSRIPKSNNPNIQVTRPRAIHPKQTRRRRYDPRLHPTPEEVRVQTNPDRGK